MTHDDTADDLSLESPAPVTAEQLATEPAHPALRALQLTAPGYDALASRIETAAASELARRRETALVVGRPQLTVIGGGLRSASVRAPRRAVGRDLTPLLARALRPALVAAAAAALFAVGFAEQGSGTGDASGGQITEAASQQVSDASAVQALSLQDPTAQWAEQGRAPTVDALGRAIGLGGAP